MNVVGVVTLGKLIEAHRDGDEQKFKAYVEFIAEAYEQQGMTVALASSATPIRAAARIPQRSSWTQPLLTDRMWRSTTRPVTMSRMSWVPAALIVVSL